MEALLLTSIVLVSVNIISDDKIKHCRQRKKLPSPKEFQFEIVFQVFWSVFYTQRFWEMAYLKVVKHEIGNIPIVFASVRVLF